MSHGALALPRTEAILPEANPWARLPMVGAGLAVVGIVLCAVFAGGQPKQFYFSWLVAYVYFLSIALGCMYFVLFQWATQAGWGIVVRRIAENGAATLPLFALLFLPIAFGMQDLFVWSRPDAVAADHLLKHKQPYLNSGFFLARAAVYFLVWSGLSLWFLGTSARMDDTQDLNLAARLRKWSAPALMPLALTHSFASIDWLMSLDAKWYSTIFGVYCFAGGLVGAFALLSLVSIGLQKAGLLRNAITVEHYHDLGKLLFAFTVFWAYIGFCQFFLIWYGNIPEETDWYRHRMHGSWLAVSVILMVGHFGIPFFYLMSRTTKRNTKLLAPAAVWMLLMHFVDIHWMVLPALHKDGAIPGIMDVAAFLAVGGMFLAVFGWHLRRRPLVPIGDPRLPESLGFENL